MTSTTTATKFLRLPAVIEMVGIKRTAIYDRIKAGAFPAPLQIGARSVAWKESEIADWQQSLTRGLKKSLVKVRVTHSAQILRPAFSFRLQDRCRNR